jgi:hypothetical protein
MSDDHKMTCSCKHCGNTIEFPDTAVTGTVVVCPKCNQWTELVNDAPPEQASESQARVKWMLIIACLALIASGAGGYLFWRTRHTTGASQPLPPITKAIAVPTNAIPSKPTPPVVVEKRPKSPDDLKAGAVQLEKTKGSSLVYAVGAVTNDSEHQRFGVRIELDLFNSAGKKLSGSAKDYKDVIEPHRDWQFHALIPDSKAVSAKVSSVKED